MSEHQHQAPRNAERHCDVAVIGGSAAGLAAALQLSRQRRAVIVVDSGEPRNAPASHMHSYLGHEGLPPSELISIGREEVRSYGTEVISGRAVEVTRGSDGRFRVELEGGGRILARRVLAATGIVDDLPDIEGLAQHWGGDVIHCPFCHGFEVRDQRIVQIVTHERGLHPAALFRQLTERFTVVLHEGVDLEHQELAALRDSGVRVVAGPVERVVTGEDGHVSAVELADGTSLDADAIAVGPRFRVRAEPFEALGLNTEEHPSGLGHYVPVDESGQTSVPGLYAAGNLTDPSQQVLQAAAAGSRTGGMISFSLAHQDMATAARPSGHEHEWEERYSGDQMWSGRPNGSLVVEVEGLAPGRALDVGAGEGGDAVWLAEQGWKVTASDISQRSLDRVAAAARERDLAIDLVRADANGLVPFEQGAFDLVSVQYVPIPRSPDLRGVRNVIDAVAPAGVLLVVGHDLEPLRSWPADHGRTPMIDPDAYAGPDDFAELLGRLPGWEVVVHEKRPRPGGAVSSHVDDIVLHARRTL